MRYIDASFDAVIPIIRLTWLAVLGHLRTCLSTLAGGTRTGRVIEEGVPVVAMEANVYQAVNTVHGWVGRFKMRSAQDFLRKSIPPTEWLIEGLLPARSSTLLVGDGGTRKSWFAQCVAVAIAAGIPLFGEMSVPKQRKVLYIQTESSEAAFQQRLFHVLGGYRLVPGDIGDRLHIITNEPLRLDSELDTNSLINDCVKRYKFDLVILVHVPPDDHTIRVTETESSCREHAPGLGNGRCTASSQFRNP